MHKDAVFITLNLESKKLLHVRHPLDESRNLHHRKESQKNQHVVNELCYPCMYVFVEVTLVVYKVILSAYGKGSAGNHQNS